MAEQPRILIEPKMWEIKDQDILSKRTAVIHIITRHFCICEKWNNFFFLSVLVH